MRTNRIVAGAAILTLITVVGFQNCSRQSFSSNVSATEASKLGEQAFKFDSNDSVAGVQGADGQPTDGLRAKDVNEAASSFVKDCSLPVTLDDGTQKSRYDFERDQALKAASADPDKKTIPVEFAVSFGQKDDRLALWAHKRAILTEGNDKEQTAIPVGDKNGSQYTENGKAYDAYYLVNHHDAKANYIAGRNCFFDTVKLASAMVKSTRTPGNERYDFISSVERNVNVAHVIHYMYFGYCAYGTTKCADSTSAYGPGAYGADTYPNRLFGAWPRIEAGAPQIVKLYVADLRDGQIGLSTAAHKIIGSGEGLIRGVELKLNVKDQVDVKTVFQNREQAIWNLSNSYTASTGDVFRGMRGVPQLLTNIGLAGMDGTVLASQYTPIVLDLGDERVRTSSRFDGTFFNMSDLSKIGAGGVASFDFTQQTSWLGGDLVNDFTKRPVANEASVISAFSRQAQDGFLVLPDENGQVKSSRQLFGDKTIVNGKTFANGFEALQALAGKNCESGALIKDRYFGPWDGELFASKVKVWVDANRNGKVDDGELKSLADSGVVAINACNIVHSEAQDIFGNGTSLRSAFLMDDKQENLVAKEAEILDRLQSGKRADGSKAAFRLAIDLIFSVNEKLSLE